MLELADRVDFINRPPVYTTPSFWFKTPKTKNPIMPFISDLNKLPFHDFNIVNTSNLLKVRDGWLSISFSRGCPFKCTFCINPLLQNILKNEASYFRVRDVPTVIEELLQLISKYPQIKVINLDDDLLMIYPKWISAFCKEYKEKIYDPWKIEFTLNCRVDMLTNKIAEQLSKCGCRELKIGVESGDEILRNKILNKNLTDEQIINAFKITDQYNLRTIAYMMMGIPGETDSAMQKSFKLLSIIKPTLTRVAFLQPYEGTEIYEYCRKTGVYDDTRKVKNWHSESPLTLPTISPTKLLFYKMLLPWHINLLYGLPYQKAIKKYEKMTYDELLQCVPQIIDEDHALSLKTKQPHFRYFNKNEYYCEFYRPGK
jgi:radical SAM superfamily enzyme YgiQ (UPF0313 family)